MVRVRLPPTPHCKHSSSIYSISVGDRQHNIYKYASKIIHYIRHNFPLHILHNIAHGHNFIVPSCISAIIIIIFDYYYLILCCDVSGGLCFSDNFSSLMVFDVSPVFWLLRISEYRPMQLERDTFNAISFHAHMHENSTQNCIQ